MPLNLLGKNNWTIKIFQVSIERLKFSIDQNQAPLLAPRLAAFKKIPK